MGPYVGIEETYLGGPPQDTLRFGPGFLDRKPLIGTPSNYAPYYYSSMIEPLIVLFGPHKVKGSLSGVVCRHRGNVSRGPAPGYITIWSRVLGKEAPHRDPQAYIHPIYYYNLLIALL